MLNVIRRFYIDFKINLFIFLGVECSLGESEPRSVLILQYKNKFTTVQV